MKIQIKSWLNGSILFEGDFSCLADAVKAAVKSRAYLSGAYLSGADLSGADLSGAYLSRADLSGAYLSGANLSGADLSYANLSGADLSGADLSYANLSSAGLSGADLSRAKNSQKTIDATRILPEGSIIGWKKCRGDVIVKLLIPEEAKRSHAFGRKCRAEFVKVLKVYGAKQGVSQYTSEVIYREGETVKCDKWNDDYTVECGGGIHFFITRSEAEGY